MIRSVAIGALALLAAAGAARATTVTSNTVDGICRAEIVLYGSPAAGGQVTLYQGALKGGTINIQVVPNQGNRVCYRRGVDPHDCASPLGPEVCAPVTPDPADVLDVR